MTNNERKLVSGWVKANVTPCKTTSWKINDFTVSKALAKDTGIILEHKEIDNFMLLNGFEIKKVKNSSRYLASIKSPFLSEFLPKKTSKKVYGFWYGNENLKCNEKYTYVLINDLVTTAQVKDLIISAAVKFKISDEEIARNYCSEFLRGAKGAKFPNAPYLNGNCTPLEVYYETLLHLYRYARAKDDGLPDLT